MNNGELGRSLVARGLAFKVGDSFVIREQPLTPLTPEQAQAADARYRALSADYTRDFQAGKARMEAEFREAEQKQREANLRGY